MQVETDSIGDLCVQHAELLHLMTKRSHEVCSKPIQLNRPSQSVSLSVLLGVAKRRRCRSVSGTVRPLSVCFSLLLAQPRRPSDACLH